MWTANPEPVIPMPKKIAEKSPDALGPYLSTKCPIKAADKPKNKIAILNVQEILVKLQLY